MKMEKAKTKTKEEILEVIGCWLDDSTRGDWKTGFDMEFLLGKEDGGRMADLYNRHCMSAKIEVKMEDGGILVNEYRNGVFSLSVSSREDRMEEAELKMIRRKNKREKEIFFKTLYFILVYCGGLILGYFSGVSL